MLQKNWMELIKPSKMDVNVLEHNEKQGSLVAEPLERGFGLTLGNALRRILLSSLQGAAITSIKIKGNNTKIIITWLDIIQNLLLPNLLRVKESIIGPKKILRVQGNIVIESNKEISTKEAPLVAR